MDTKTTINSLMRSVDNILVPAYQRGYSWEKKQLDQFIKDLEDYLLTNANKEHEQIVAKLISLSSEIYVINDTFNYGRLSSNYYKTCYYVESWTYGGLEEKGTYPGTYYTYPQIKFTFT